LLFEPGPLTLHEHLEERVVRKVVVATNFEAGLAGVAAVGRGQLLRLL
jgi:hypothetical protein